MSLPSSYTISPPGKIKEVPLPPISAWDRVLDASPTSIVYSFASVDIVNYKRLFFGGVDVGPAYCIISSDGYIVIYEYESALDGYAFDLTRAKGMRVKEEIGFRGKTIAMKVVIEWSFGKLNLRLYDNFKQAKGALYAAFRKRSAAGVFRVVASQEIPNAPTLDYDRALREGDKAKESVRTVAIPYKLSIPIVGGGVEDVVEVSITASDERIDAIHATITNKEGGLNVLLGS